MYVAGVLGSDPANPDKDPGGVAQQTRQALRNVEAILLAAGSSLDKVVRMIVYASDMDMWAEVNAAYAEVMGDHRPSRAIVPVKNFKGPYVIEIVATAVVDD